MITAENLSQLRTFFNDYLKSFDQSDANVAKNIELKRIHTEKVVENIKAIGRSIPLSEEDLFLAESIALLHDIGRFPQFAKYQTFDDDESENHAEWSVRIINENNLLDNFDERSKDIVLKAISCHNRLDLPLKEEENTSRFCYLIRDADKLDVLRIVSEYVKVKNNAKNDSIVLDLPDKNDISEKVIKRLHAHLPANKEDLKTQADFKLMLMSWAYDLHFRKSYQMISQNQYVQKIFETLPKNDNVLSLYRQIKIHIENKLM